MTKKTVLSGIQPTGDIHLGNYFGAIKKWVQIQSDYKCIYGVVDLHAITINYDPKVLKKNTRQMVVDLLASGIDPDKSIIFVQSRVPEHTELCWLLSSISSYGELTRMTQFKDKSEQISKSSNKEFISAGLFTYPVLQAADILIYNAHYVPVGKDQEQHLELSRNIAVRFNNKFGQFFNEPKPLYTEIPKLMSTADPSKKMSKSLGPKHYIGLFEDEESIRRKIRSAVTDTGETQGEKMSPGVLNLFTLIKACGDVEIHDQLLQQYQNGELKYKELKDTVADSIVKLTGNFRKKKEELLNDNPYIDSIITEHSDKARKIASNTVIHVKKLMGLN